MNLSQSCRWLPILLPLALASHHARDAEPAPKPQTQLKTQTQLPPVIQSWFIAPRKPFILPPRISPRAQKQRGLDQALMRACQKNDFQEARALLHRGANPNGRAEDGTPLFFDFVRGSSSRQNRGLRFLLEHGANLNARAGADSLYPSATALMWAASTFTDDVDAIAILLSHGADINARNSRGQTALHDAASVCGSCACASNSDAGIALIKHDANVNAVDHDGNTPLLLLMESDLDDLKLARALLAHGASISHRNKKGKDALQIARESAYIYPKMLHLLQQASKAHR